MKRTNLFKVCLTFRIWTFSDQWFTKKCYLGDILLTFEKFLSFWNLIENVNKLYSASKQTQFEAQPRIENLKGSLWHKIETKN